MKRISVVAIFGLLIVMAVTLASAGGSDDESTTAGAEFKTHDDLLLAINERVPEFGGMFLSEDNEILYTYVTGDSEYTLNTETVKQTIVDVLKSDPTQGRELRLIPARYSMLQLYGWYSQVQGVVWSNPNVTLTDLQEGENRIEVGVDSSDAVVEVETSLLSLGIPSDAFVVQIRELPHPQSHTLQDRASGGVIEGGYQIEGVGVGNCTLGFNVDRSGEAGIITNGHCTESNWDGGVDGTEFYQPDDSTSANLIGEETIDPPFSSNYSNCPAGKVCRYSDAAFVELASGVSRNLGKIAKTSLGSINVYHPASYRIVGEDNSTTVGETVFKVGRTTGRTEATITGTCVTYQGLGNRVLLCQDTASGNSSGGDSGSPVFRITNSPNTNDVELLGVHHSGGSSTIVFSSIGQIYYELGSNDTWDACDSSFGC